MQNKSLQKGITGCPLITEHALSVLGGEVIDQVDLGAHTVFIGNVFRSEVLEEGTPITYQYYHKVLKGNLTNTYDEVIDYIGGRAAPVDVPG